MEKECSNAVFGRMSYKHGWYKCEKMTIFGKLYSLKISAAAYSGQPITEEQEKAYQNFTAAQDKYFAAAGSSLKKYIKDNMNSISEFWPKARVIEDDKDLPQVVTPKTLLIKQDGTVILLLECEWNEEDGIAVELIPELSAGSQDLFL